MDSVDCTALLFCLYGCRVTAEAERRQILAQPDGALAVNLVLPLEGVFDGAPNLYDGAHVQVVRDRRWRSPARQRGCRSMWPAD